MKQYIIFDLDGTLVSSAWKVTSWIKQYFVENYRYIDANGLIEYIHQTAWTPLWEQVQYYLKDTQEDHEKITWELYDILSRMESDFFPWVVEIIKKLSNSYTLFLSTWNSDIFAEKNLRRENIYNCFKLVLGSVHIPKWPRHIEAFRESVWDDDFIQKSIYVWDGSTDRNIAHSHNIDFIHISIDGGDKYEIESVKDIYDILHTL